MNQSHVRVKFAGAQNARMRAVIGRLRSAGMKIDPVRLSENGSPDIKRGELDVLLWMIQSKNENGDIEQLEMFRQLNIPVHIIAVAAGDKIAACLDAGADDCVVPAIDALELEARIRARLRRHGGMAKIIRIHDLEVDLQTRSVVRAGQEIQLTPREFAILEILAAHRGKVVTRVMMWQRLYQETERYASNVIDVYIRYLRQKIDKDFAPPLITTVWGRGYMLRDDGVEAVE